MPAGHSFSDHAVLKLRHADRAHSRRHRVGAYFAEHVVERDLVRRDEL
jgi:hypothetical protein